ncbi:ATP-binding protein [Bosea sp. ASV33]|uniref:AlbA family DNA-binding domain-containing protein n=1 Tax=Bosea sp. ASV33 TaxID=2795106 RepID=UPI0018ED3ACB|nr:ATP-binding protein [Bosea sp. ASV33]
MRGKPIELVTLEDIDQLISDKVAEGRRIEFKSDIPVSAEEQRVHAKGNPGERALDRSWVQGKKFSKFGRDALLEEIVAFANAEGGTLILGMEETSDQPARASHINRLPDVAGLERRLRDVIVDCIEPRLPYFAVRALPIAKDGSGIVLIETGASALSPHWVSWSRKPTIRREDRCDTLTMSEVHEMVLRHSRRIDAMTSLLVAERVSFFKAFRDNVRRRKPSNYMGDTAQMIKKWLDETGQSALGAQVVVVPHFGLGMPRLERLAGLVPPADAITVEGPAGPFKTQFLAPYEYASSNPGKILGGVRADQTGGFDKSVRAMRDGTVAVSFKPVQLEWRWACSISSVGKLATHPPQLR